MENIKPFKFIGIGVRTSNTTGKATKDLGELWGRFFQDQVGEKIGGKVKEDIYSIYTDYESNYTGEYTCLIGFQVESVENVPQGMIGREFEGGKYRKFVAKGEMPEAVVTTWQEIWQKDAELGRQYTVDFEVYGPKCQQGDTSEVDIFIAVN